VIKTFKGPAAMGRGLKKSRFGTLATLGEGGKKKTGREGGEVSGKLFRGKKRWIESAAS